MAPIYPAKAQKVEVTPLTYLTFKSITDLPYVLEWPATVTDGKYIYAINGYGAYEKGFNPDVLKYDPQTQKWSRFTDKAGFKLQPCAALVPAVNHVYIFGGTKDNGRQVYQGVQSLNLADSTVQDLHLLNPMASTYGGAAEWQNEIYLFGGTQSGTHTISSLYRFSPVLREFTQLADMPESLQTPGAIINGVLYTFGGYDVFLKRTSASINAYDINTNTWKTIGNLPNPISADLVVPCGELVFVIGDYNDETFLGYYNTRTSLFTELRSNMAGRRACGAAIIDNILYVFGGKSEQQRVTGGSRTGQCVDISGILKKELAP